MVCNYCKGTEYDLVAKYTRFEENDVLRCRDCGLVYLDQKKKKKEIESFYSSDYRKTPAMPVQSAEKHYNDEVTRHDVETRIAFISEHVDINNKKILEVGSASGKLLDKLSEYGAKEVVGIELGKEYADFSQKKGFKVFRNSIEELDIVKEFDVIVSFHTLEHVFDPLAVIVSIYTALKPGGCFLGEVPNQDDWRIKIFDDEIVKRLHYDPNHYYYFSPITLNNYLETCGFDNIQLETVERYNSLLQLRRILCEKDSEVSAERYLKKYIFPENKRDDTRLPDTDDEIECEFNKIFEKGVNSELMGNCLRWTAFKKVEKK